MVRIVLQRLFPIAALFALAGISAQAQTKVAVVNLQQAVLETDEIKKASAALEAKYRPRQAELQKLQDELQSIQQQLQAGQGKLTPQAEADLTFRAQRIQRDLQRRTQDLQEEFDAERTTILNTAGRRMQEAVRKIAEAGGYDIVIDAGTTIYVKPASDITKQAIAEFSKTAPAPAPAPAK